MFAGRKSLKASFDNAAEKSIIITNFFKVHNNSIVILYKKALKNCDNN